MQTSRSSRRDASVLSERFQVLAQENPRSDNGGCIFLRSDAVEVNHKRVQRAHFEIWLSVKRNRRRQLMRSL